MAQGVANAAKPNDRRAIVCGKDYILIPSFETARSFDKLRTGLLRMSLVRALVGKNGKDIETYVENFGDMRLPLTALSSTHEAKNARD